MWESLSVVESIFGFLVSITLLSGFLVIWIWMNTFEFPLRCPCPARSNLHVQVVFKVDCVGVIKIYFSWHLIKAPLRALNYCSVAFPCWFVLTLMYLDWRHVMGNLRVCQEPYGDLKVHCDGFCILICFVHARFQGMCIF